MDVNAKTPCNISLELVERLFSGIAVGDSPYSSITLKPIDESQPWLHIEHGGDLYGSPNAVCILAADGDPSKAVKECMTANPLVEGSLRELAFEFMAGGPVGDIMISGLGEGYTVTRDDHTDNNISIQITDQETGRIDQSLEFTSDGSFACSFTDRESSDGNKDIYTGIHADDGFHTATYYDATDSEFFTTGNGSINGTLVQEGTIREDETGRLVYTTSGNYPQPDMVDQTIADPYGQHVVKHEIREMLSAVTPEGRIDHEELSRSSTYHSMAASEQDMQRAEHDPLGEVNLSLETDVAARDHITVTTEGDFTTRIAERVENHHIEDEYAGSINDSEIRMNSTVETNLNTGDVTRTSHEVQLDKNEDGSFSVFAYDNDNYQDERSFTVTPAGVRFDSYDRISDMVTNAAGNALGVLAGDGLDLSSLPAGLMDKIGATKESLSTSDIIDVAVAFIGASLPVGQQESFSTFGADELKSALLTGYVPAEYREAYKELCDKTAMDGFSPFKVLSFYYIGDSCDLTSVKTFELEKTSNGMFNLKGDPGVSMDSVIHFVPERIQNINTVKDIKSKAGVLNPDVVEKITVTIEKDPSNDIHVRAVSDSGEEKDYTYNMGYVVSTEIETSNKNGGTDTFMLREIINSSGDRIVGGSTLSDIAGDSPLYSRVSRLESIRHRFEEFNITDRSANTFHITDTMDIKDMQPFGMNNFLEEARHCPCKDEIGLKTDAIARENIMVAGIKSERLTIKLDDLESVRDKIRMAANNAIISRYEVRQELSAANDDAKTYIRNIDKQYTRLKTAADKDPDKMDTFKEFEGKLIAAKEKHNQIYNLRGQIEALNTSDMPVPARERNELAARFNTAKEELGSLIRNIGPDGQGIMDKIEDIKGFHDGKAREAINICNREEGADKAALQTVSTLIAADRGDGRIDPHNMDLAAMKLNLDDPTDAVLRFEDPNGGPVERIISTLRTPTQMFNYINALERIEATGQTFAERDAIERYVDAKGLEIKDEKIYSPLGFTVPVDSHLQVTEKNITFDRSMVKDADVMYTRFGFSSVTLEGKEIPDLGKFFSDRLENSKDMASFVKYCLPRVFLFRPDGSMMNLKNWISSFKDEIAAENRRDVTRFTDEPSIDEKNYDAIGWLPGAVEATAMDESYRTDAVDDPDMTVVTPSADKGPHSKRDFEREDKRNYTVTNGKVESIRELGSRALSQQKMEAVTAESKREAETCKDEKLRDEAAKEAFSDYADKPGGSIDAKDPDAFDRFVKSEEGQQAITEKLADKIKEQKIEALLDKYTGIATQIEGLKAERDKYVSNFSSRTSMRQDQIYLNINYKIDRLALDLEKLGMAVGDGMYLEKAPTAADRISAVFQMNQSNPYITAFRAGIAGKEFFDHMFSYFTHSGNIMDKDVLMGGRIGGEIAGTIAGRAIGAVYFGVELLVSPISIVFYLVGAAMSGASKVDTTPQDVERHSTGRTDADPSILKPDKPMDPVANSDPIPAITGDMDKNMDNKDNLNVEKNVGLSDKPDESSIITKDMDRDTDKAAGDAASLDKTSPDAISGSETAPVTMEDADKNMATDKVERADPENSDISSKQETVPDNEGRAQEAVPDDTGTEIAAAPINDDDGEHDSAEKNVSSDSDDHDTDNVKAVESNIDERMEALKEAVKGDLDPNKENDDTAVNMIQDMFDNTVNEDTDTLAQEVADTVGTAISEAAHQPENADNPEFEKAAGDLVHEVASVISEESAGNAEIEKAEGEAHESDTNISVPDPDESAIPPADSNATTTDQDNTDVPDSETTINNEEYPRETASDNETNRDNGSDSIDYDDARDMINNAMDVEPDQAERINDAADDAKAQDMDGYMDTPVDNYPDAPEISEPEYNDFEMDIADVYKTFGDAVDVPDNDLSNDRTNTDIDTGTDTDTGTDSFADTDSDNSYVDAADPPSSFDYSPVEW